MVKRERIVLPAGLATLYHKVWDSGEEEFYSLEIQHVRQEITKKHWDSWKAGTFFRVEDVTDAS